MGNRLPGRASYRLRDLSEKQPCDLRGLWAATDRVSFPRVPRCVKVGGEGARGDAVRAPSTDLRRRKLRSAFDELPSRDVARGDLGPAII